MMSCFAAKMWFRTSKNCAVINLSEILSIVLDTFTLFILVYIVMKGLFNAYRNARLHTINAHQIKSGQVRCKLSLCAVQGNLGVDKAIII